MKLRIMIILLISPLLLCSRIYAENNTTGISTAAPPAPAVNVPTKPVSAADTNIMTSVSGSIAQDNNMSGSNITVSCEDGVVSLNGTVISQAQADTAVNDAKQVAGVKDVKSNISVNNPGVSGSQSY